ncbi:MAG: hypothetical protein Unbinned1068contig1000_3 [Prokaryotic dsDNA virus sp.]|nr:MAG: hypothetical protein Unbinned1068contig1000_3 [Prokaryotic dsDNA virus sp.]|tara:strand:+ start:1206 stop:2543 length:1338 start_codon:yes stop_codon:yes gene_type:complete
MKQGNIVCTPNSSDGMQNLFTALLEREELKKDVIIPTRDMHGYLQPRNRATEFTADPLPYSGLVFEAGNNLTGDTTTFIPSPFFLEKFGAWADISQTYMRKMVNKINLARRNYIDAYTEARKENIPDDHVMWHYKHELDSLNDMMLTNIAHFFEFPATTRFDAQGNAPAHSRQLFRMLNGKDGRDGVIRTMLSSKYKLLDDMPAVDALTRALESELSDTSGFYLESAHVGETSTRMKFVNTNLAVEIDGHPVNYMLDIVNSETGTTSFKMNEGYFYQWCTNGAIKRQITRSIHVGMSKDEYVSEHTIKKEGELLWSQIGDAVEASMKQETMDKLAEQIIDAKKVTFNQPEKLAEDVTKKFKLSDYESNGFLANLLKDADQFGMNKWGASNALTSVAKSVQDYDRATELEEQGAKLLEVPASYFEKHTQKAHVVPAGDVWQRMEQS